MRRGYRGGHLGQHLDEYVDGTLNSYAAQRAARHLIACESCRRDVSAEREVLRRIRAVEVDPARQASLVANLLSVRSDEPSHGVPAEQPLEAPGAVRLLAPTAPAQYDRKRRAPIVALAALGVSCAGLVVAGGVAPHRSQPGGGHPVYRTSMRAAAQASLMARVRRSERLDVAWPGHASGAPVLKRAASGTIGP